MNSMGTMKLTCRQHLKEDFTQMNTDDELPDEATETGSDELLSDDNLRLPESASPLVRLHAIRAWLARRQKETTLEIGEAALTLQHRLQQEPRLRRRERQNYAEQIQHTQQMLSEAQQHLSAYEEAQSLLEECITHTTSGERVLVEYYLMLDEKAQNRVQAGESEHSPWLQAFSEVQHRVEHVGVPYEE
jgi:hypothetical protein